MITLRLLGLAGFCRWCGFEAPGPVFFGAKRRERLQFVEFSIFSARPSYSTPLPNHFPGSWCTPEQVSRCGSSHRRLEAFRVDLVHFVHFSLRKRFPKHVKPPLRCKFDFFVGVGTLKFTQNVVYAAHARFRASFAVWFRAQSPTDFPRSNH